MHRHQSRDEARRLSNGTVQRIKWEMAMQRIKEEKAVSAVQLC